METCACGYLKVNYIHIIIGFRLAYFVAVKSDRLLDHALQCKTIIQCLNLFAFDHYRFISRREHDVIHDHILYCHLLNKQKQKYRGMFETQKSRNKTSSGDIGLNIRTLASQKCTFMRWYKATIWCIIDVFLCSWRSQSHITLISNTTPIIVAVGREYYWNG